MTCRLLRSQIIELARGRLPGGSGTIHRSLITAHVSICPACGVFMEEQVRLTAVFDEFGAETEMAPPSNLESILLEEFDEIESNRRLHHRRVKVAVGASVAIAAGLLWLAIMPRGHVIPVPSRVEALAALRPIVPATDVPVQTAEPAIQKPAPKRVRRQAAKPADDAAPFFAIPYTVPLDPRERAVVMRMDMPVTALAAVGLTVAAPDPRASAQTDVIVGEDGRIRAIRLLSISISNQDRSVYP